MRNSRDTELIVVYFPRFQFWICLTKPFWKANSKRVKTWIKKTEPETKDKTCRLWAGLWNKHFALNSVCEFSAKVTSVFMCERYIQRWTKHLLKLIFRVCHSDYTNCLYVAHGSEVARLILSRGVQGLFFPVLFTNINATSIWSQPQPPTHRMFF